MEFFRITLLHLGIFAGVGAVGLISRLTVRATRVVRLNLECRQLGTSKQKTPVFAGVHPVLLRMEQGAAGNFSNGKSEWPGQVSV
jgi:hypothetical protein